MASRVIHDKIPHNVRVNKVANMTATLSQAELKRIYRAAAGMDAVKPSVTGRQGVKPSTIGIAAQKRFAQLAKVAAVAKGGLDAITTIRDSAEAYPELAALANDPRFIAVIQRVIAKIGKEVDSLTHDSLSAARNEVAGSAEERDEINQRIAREEGLGGFDAARPILTAEDAERVERARAKVSRLKTAEGMGDAGDIVRARSGMDERALDADGLYGLFEGKRK